MRRIPGDIPIFSTWLARAHWTSHAVKVRVLGFFIGLVTAVQLIFVAAIQLILLTTITAHRDNFDRIGCRLSPEHLCAAFRDPTPWGSRIMR